MRARPTKVTLISRCCVNDRNENFLTEMVRSISCLPLIIFYFTLFVIRRCAVDTYKILGVFPMPMHSHYQIASAVLRELARKGHDVTVINPYPSSVSSEKNYHDISVANIIGPINEHKKSLLHLEVEDEWTCIRYLTEMGLVMTRLTLESANVQAVLNQSTTAIVEEHHQQQQQYDAVLVAQFMNEAHMAIATHFRAPLILVATMPLFSWTNFFLAHPSPPSYVPNLLGRRPSVMTFWQRLTNTFFDFVAIAYHQFVLLPEHKRLARKLIPSHPNLNDALNNVSLVLVNSHEAIYDAIPSSPQIKSIAGVHLQDHDGYMSSDLKEFLDNGPTVLFSMGSNLNVSTFPANKLKVIYDTVLSIDGLQVVWKWELDKFPFHENKRIKLMSWIPQQSVLAHTNVRAFISHGGLLSTIESVYSGIPIFGLPIFTDQKMNIATAVDKGYALSIPLHQLTVNEFRKALLQLLHDKKYKAEAMRRSAILRDNPMNPLQSAVYWTEYVIRHKGAVHLRHAGAQLWWFQRHLLDVLLTMIILAWCLFKLTQLVFRWLST